MTDVLICTYDDFPDGLRCSECNREIEWGDRYSERVVGMMGDTFADLTGEPVVEVELVCLRCVGKTLHVAGEIVPLYDADLSPINRDDD